MAGTSLTYRLEGLQEMLGGLMSRMQSTQPAMKIVGEILRTSVVRNFEVGGRPEKWQPLSKAYIRRRKKGAASILRLTGRLMNSINARATDDSAIVGTNVEYARIHQLGGEIKRVTKAGAMPVNKAGKFMSRKAASRRKTAVAVRFHGGGKSYVITMPARPYLVVQEEDRVEMLRAVKEYITTGNPGTAGGAS
jgi:phage virion morphogenesis protein